MFNKLFNPQRDDIGDLETIKFLELWIGHIWTALHWSWPPLDSHRVDNEGCHSWHKGPFWFRWYPHKEYAGTP